MSSLRQRQMESLNSLAEPGGTVADAEATIARLDAKGREAAAAINAQIRAKPGKTRQEQVTTRRMFTGSR